MKTSGSLFLIGDFAELMRGGFGLWSAEDEVGLERAITADVAAFLGFEPEPLFERAPAVANEWPVEAVGRMSVFREHREFLKRRRGHKRGASHEAKYFERLARARGAS